jgi:chemosensory pili system protein ChpA (sensor histidine kinase/response regulator)
MARSHELIKDPYHDGIPKPPILHSHAGAEIRDAAISPPPVIPFPAGPAQAPEPVALRRLTSPHVLVMDSQLELLDVLGELFHQEGYSVTLASRPLPIETIVDIAPDVIVLEAMFDGADGGCRLIRELRADERVRAIPVICCTLTRDLADWLSLEGIPILLKPYDLDDLLHAVSGRVGQRHH